MTSPSKGLPPTPPDRVRTPSARALATLVAGLVLIKLIWLLGDPTLRLFMGDSASYLHSALTGWMPPDRSFTYGFLVRASAVAFASPLALVLLQTAFGIATSLLLTGLLHRLLGLRFSLAAAAGLLLALDPGQLFYERMMMAESAGTLALAAHVVLLAVYARTGQWRWVARAALFGIAAVSLRFSLLPVVLGLAVGAAVVAALSAPRRHAMPLAMALQVGVALALTGTLHLAYMQSYRIMPGGEATYMPASGMMRIGLVAPMVRAEHFEGTGVPGTVLEEVKLDVSDPRQREAHVWTADGLYAAIARHTDQPERVARTITSRALRDDPARLVSLGLGNFADYFDRGLREHRIQDDLGRRPPDAGVLAALRERLDYEAEGVSASDSWATRWFRNGAPWLIACLFSLAPLALLALAMNWRGPHRPAVLVLCLASLGLVASHLLFAHIPSLRYLHPMPWFVLANLALLAQALLRRSQGPGTAR
jgi:hypothetical protein